MQLVIPANSTRRVPVRCKGGVIPHKKPRWIPPAKSKMFTLKRVDHTPQSEIEQLNTLKHNYKAHFNAVTQYLYEVGRCCRAYTQFPLKRDSVDFRLICPKMFLHLMAISE